MTRRVDIDLIIEQGGWPSERELKDLCERAVDATLSCMRQTLPDSAEVSFLFTDDQQVRALNASWRDQDKATNVLSFATNEGEGPLTPLLGDIVLAFETVKKEAETQQKTFDHHLTHLIIHGFLHLLGYDHICDEDATLMEELEIKILSTLCIDNPYIAESVS